MVDIIRSIMSDILTSLYQPFWFSLLAAVLLLFLYLYASDHGWEEAFRAWIKTFKKSLQFRKLFLLSFFTMMILMRTLLNRTMWSNPLSDVIGTWGLYNAKGEFTTECIENLVLFTPFIVLLLWVAKDKILKRITIWTVLWKATEITFLFSFTIEMLQLFLRLGTWQLSDLFYNTLGGAIGGLIYYVGYRIKYR